MAAYLYHVSKLYLNGQKKMLDKIEKDKIEQKIILDSIQSNKLEENKKPIQVLKIINEKLIELKQDILESDSDVETSEEN
tara:strand:+ start:51 stop:290 length:240 start_codon:yes stop_codon:yes gene_type:complete